jgi:dephospho-CoA kinase
MICVGLTGGIGSGKSTVSRLLARRGAVIVDADAIVHELQQPGAPLLDRLAERFGREIVRDDGSLDRAKLAEIAFADAAAVQDLNGLVHPAVRAEMSARVRGHVGTSHVVVLDVPIVTGERPHGTSALVVVDAPVDVAIERLVSQRGMSEADARARVSKQISREERLAIADRVIDNSGDLASLERQVDDVWAWMHTLPPFEDAPADSPPASREPAHFDGQP